MTRGTSALLGAALWVTCGVSCAPETGLVFQVTGGQNAATPTSSLELFVTHRSFCDRTVEDESASHTRVDVKGRDLTKRPFEFWVHPFMITDLADPVSAVVVGRNDAGEIIGRAVFAPQPFKYEAVLRYRAPLQRLSRTDIEYATADGCLCLPGAPWLATPSTSACGQKIPPSYERLLDTAGCELPTGAPLPVGVCDGQLYPGEVADREVPCFSSGDGSCRIGTRTCHDERGRALDGECFPETGAPTLPTRALCDAYRTCEADACSDPNRCLVTSVPPATTLHCTLHYSGNGDQPPVPCGDGHWQAALNLGGTGAACTATLPAGRAAPPLTLGLLTAQNATASTVSALCPPTLAVTEIAGTAASLPATVEFDMTIGDRLVRVETRLEPSCAGDTLPSLSCTQ
jgi:hypothetical protein